ncbi:hypothetical protein CDAR_447731 [Caerostris darwini]|uniref:Uncharacterized protein n=1 Tax=Caerostris darwini TaxID=1538125 RepID=A0AAV4PQU9_9ARAC|nr:hypothetical protein CDAR_447731 [Caerostris darwini]
MHRSHQRGRGRREGQSNPKTINKNKRTKPKLYCGGGVPSPTNKYLNTAESSADLKGKIVCPSLSRGPTAAASHYTSELRGWEAVTQSPHPILSLLLLFFAPLPRIFLQREELAARSELSSGLRVDGGRGLASTP